MFSKIMEYVDTQHKRAEFNAESFAFDSEGTNRRITFVGRGQGESVTLVERGSSLVALLSKAECELVLSKAQILEQQGWLTLDFEDNPVLRRLLIHIGRLNSNALDGALRSLIGVRSLLYFRRK
jgi:hypothetical protein